MTGVKRCKKILLGAGAAIALSVGTLDIAAAQQKATAGPITIADQGNFFVGGHYTQTKDGQIMAGQMYVQYQIPAHETHPYPIVIIHGGGVTGEGYYETPDGREGWATYFLRQGYAVYVVDQVDRGRSGYFGSVYGPTRKPNTKAMMQRFSVPQDQPLYPQAHLHTQWPGTGKAGDPVFDQFFASQVEDMVNLERLETMDRAAADALLDKIGPVILLTHSQSGPVGWAVANDRPNEVKVIIAIESSGPPFHDVIEQGPPDWFKNDPKLVRPYGLTESPIAYDPPLSSPSDLKPVEQAKADQPDLVRCWLQSSPAHKLVNLDKVPVLMIGSAASYHVPYDHCTAKYLAQAGVNVQFIRLPSVGIDGNGHFMMLEKNSLQIAAFLNSWIETSIH
jgi:pimeloyl-ACP methyl ester carboxylesterase